MSLPAELAENRVNPYEPAVIPSGDQFGSPCVRFSASFWFAIVLTGGLFFAVLLTQYRFKEIFIGFGIQLPFPVIIALHPGILAVVCSLFLFTVAKERIYPAGVFVLLANRLVCLAALMIGFAYAAAMFFPLIPILQSF